MRPPSPRGGWSGILKIMVVMAVDCTTLSLEAALGGCSAIATAYVASLYLVTPRSADRAESARVLAEPSVVRRRMAAVCLATALAPAVLAGLAEVHTGGVGLLETVGLRVDQPVGAVLRPLAINVLLFAGPLLQLALDGEVGEEVQRHAESLRSVAGWRVLVVAPITEELAFRGCMVPLLAPHLGRGAALVWGTPLFFGLAHVHHLLEGHPPAIVALQAGYTTLFGAYATLAFARTGSILGPIACHAFCNAMGFPNFPGAARHKRRGVLGAAYAAGLAGFLWMATHAL